eukprot:977734-Amphidinium_carterae.1
MHDLRGCPGRELDHKAKIQETLSSRRAWQAHLAWENSQSPDVHRLLWITPQQQESRATYWGCVRCGRIIEGKQFLQLQNSKCTGKPLKAGAKQRARKWSAQCNQSGWRPDQPLSDV